MVKKVDYKKARKRRQKPIKRKDRNLPMRVFIYCRYSLANTLQNAQSNEIQEDICRAYCKANGLEVEKVFHDDGFSGTIELENRPGGAKLVREIKRHVSDPRPTQVVVYKMDRAFRSAINCLHWMEEWATIDVGVSIVDGHGTTIDTRSPMGRMMVGIMSMVAEMERNNISDRTREAIHYRLYKEGRQGRNSLAPFGYRVGPDGKLIPIPEQLDCLRTVLKMRCESRLGPNQIAYRLSKGRWAKFGLNQNRIRSILNRIRKANDRGYMDMESIFPGIGIDHSVEDVMSAKGSHDAIKYSLIKNPVRDPEKTGDCSGSPDEGICQESQ